MLYNKAHFGIKNTRFGVFIQRMVQSISKYLVALVQWFLFCSQQTRRSTLAATTNSKSSTSEPVHCRQGRKESWLYNISNQNISEKKNLKPSSNLLRQMIALKWKKWWQCKTGFYILKVKEWKNNQIIILIFGFFSHTHNIHKQCELFEKAVKKRELCPRIWQKKWIIKYVLNIQRRP